VALVVATLPSQWVPLALGLQGLVQIGKQMVLVVSHSAAPPLRRKAHELLQAALLVEALSSQWVRRGARKP
jgi:hypothetical protein